MSLPFLLLFARGVPAMSFPGAAGFARANGRIAGGPLVPTWTRVTWFWRSRTSHNRHYRSSAIFGTLTSRWVETGVR